MFLLVVVRVIYKEVGNCSIDPQHRKTVIPCDRNVMNRVVPNFRLKSIMPHICIGEPSVIYMQYCDQSTVDINNITRGGEGLDIPVGWA